MVRAIANRQSVQAGRSNGRLRLVIAWILVVLALLPWRSQTYYSGGVDPTVAVKAVLQIVALVLALGRALPGRLYAALGPRTLAIVFAFVLFACLGGWAAGSPVTSAILGIRILLIVATVALLMVSYPHDVALTSGIMVLAGVGMFCGLSGLGKVGATGRLYGGILPINPNQISLMISPLVIWLVWRMLQAQARLVEYALLVVLFATTWLTGSRTGLVGLIIGIVIVLMYARRLPLGGMLSIIFCMPVLLWIVGFTGVIAGYVGRNGDGHVMTLSSRTIAWSAAFSAPTDFWSHWFGGGLNVTTVSVTGQWWNQQVVDSSWVSAYIQAGVVGVALLALWSFTCLTASFRAPRATRGLMIALVVNAIIRSALETGLIGSFVLFVVMLIPALTCEIRPRTKPPEHIRLTQSPMQPDRNAASAAPAELNGTR
ncbi:O-antigen ligase family protein [Leekyejoonella antrihumi]|uniref:O-antigen ligase family protein n=1 Tax=Leekyejoonella antrihumi TaxID=1660198 RepID=A0A563DTC0_9MICO|nr:O-antigen ligase family protein [Leekyejoonella antrihumi]TWP33485.1 O-antigen ligase family protein [Leekyejoonella antrihumi]